MMSDLY